MADYVDWEEYDSVMGEYNKLGDALEKAGKKATDCKDAKAKYSKAQKEFDDFMRVKLEHGGIAKTLTRKKRRGTKRRGTKRRGTKRRGTKRRGTKRRGTKRRNRR